MTRLALRLGILTCTVLTMSGAVLVLGFMGVQQDFDPARAAVASGVLGAGLLTAWHVIRGGLELFQLFMATGLVALGAAGATYGMMQGQISGDLEAWAVTLCALLTAQGSGTLLYMWTN